MFGMQTLNLARLRFAAIYHFDVARGTGDLAALIFEARVQSFSSGTGRLLSRKGIEGPQVRPNQPTRHLLGANHVRCGLDGDG